MGPPADAEPGEPGDDDPLILSFMCCHPALTRPSAIALTLLQAAIAAVHDEAARVLFADNSRLIFDMHTQQDGTAFTPQEREPGRQSSLFESK